MKEALYYHKTDLGIQCDLCPHACLLKEGQTGRCRVRIVKDGRLMAKSYGRISSAQVDPVEKKPLYHFHPASEIFSIGGWGCSFSCAFCQNWTISQKTLNSGTPVTPADLINRALAMCSSGIAYTYNEPLIAFEFVKECAELAQKQNLANVLVTNGYINPDPASKLLPYIDALNIDIKSMDDAFYRKHCGGTLEPVLDFAVQAKQSGSHLEITNLLIPQENDDTEIIETLAVWVTEHLGEMTPLHLSAYHPQYKFNNPPTPSRTLETAYEICRKHLQFVYLGNVISQKGRDTVCPSCGKLLISRQGYSTQITGLKNGICAKCGKSFEQMIKT